jgi:signal transduction histidine kinase
MKRLKALIYFFCLAIAIPLAFVIWQTYQGLAREEKSQLRFFSETLFDEMEIELSRLVQREENRSVDEYHHTLAGNLQSPVRSPLSRPPKESFVIGYLQNNPDGSFQTPLVADLGRVPVKQRPLVEQFKVINTIFNSKKFALAKKQTPPYEVAEPERKEQTSKKEKDDFADRYLARPQQKVAKGYLGKKTSRTEEITVGQALNLSREDESILRSRKQEDRNVSIERSTLSEADRAVTSVETLSEQVVPAPPGTMKAGDKAEPNRFQVEVAPLQSVLIEKDLFFIFRRIAINNQIYRQGLVIRARPLLQHLANAHFASQPMAQFSRLSLKIASNGVSNEIAFAGTPVQAATFTVQRIFPAPFDFCSAAIQTDSIPGSSARQTLNVALIVLGFFLFLGLLSIYHSARTIVEVSERRSQFVSSVTHELKTPLTNIRLYIEMLEQGMAANPEREQDYFQILGSESARLSRLINNVLELSKLEKKRRHFNMQSGNLTDVLSEVERVMAPKLMQEGFTLIIDNRDMPTFSYDSEVMIQILINLIENSVKFGRTATTRKITICIATRNGQVRIAVSDTGPGIPRKALKKVFGDFYRVDNDLTRTTAGTGIGLALVKKFIETMGGRVQAINNDGPGCTIILNLPITNPKPS